MTCSIIWIPSCELWLRRRLKGRKTCSSPKSYLDRSCPSIMLKWLQRFVCHWFLPISSILSGSCDRLESGTREWILILRMRHPTLPNTKRPFWSMWRMNTVPNTDACWSINSTAYQAAITSPLQHQHNVKWFGSHNSMTKLVWTATPILPEAPRSSRTGWMQNNVLLRCSESTFRCSSTLLM